MFEDRVGEAGAIYAFMSWLTTREEESGPFSSNHLVGNAPDLVAEFCKSQGWTTNEGWHSLLKPYPGK